MDQIAKQARLAANGLAALPLEARNAVLSYIKEELIASRPTIADANHRDLAQLEESPLKKRLLIDDAKFDSLLQGLDDVIRLPDPIGKVSLKTELTEGLVLKRVSCPIGVLLMIYEARPEAGVQIASLALKSANALILKGGKEAVHSNRAIYEAITKALTKAHSEFGLPLNTLQLVESRDEVTELLKMDTSIDLVIPRGSNALVRNIKESTKIAVLGHADGICKIFVDETVPDTDKAVEIIVDSKTNYVAACNALETLLVHEKIAATILPKIAEATKKWPVKFVADAEAAKHLPADRTESSTDEDMHREFLDYVMAVKTVKSLDEAIDHINEYSSHHTDCILSGDQEHIDAFMRRVDSSGVYANCSTRFADGYRYGFGAEVGISTSRIHSRGPVGLEGLTLYKYLLHGAGHTVGEMGKARQFTHKSLL